MFVVLLAARRHRVGLKACRSDGTISSEAEIFLSVDYVGRIVCPRIGPTSRLRVLRHVADAINNREPYWWISNFGQVAPATKASNCYGSSPSAQRSS